MKKLLSLVLLLAILCGIFAPISYADGDDFVKVSVPCPDSIKDNEKWRTYLRYKDTKEAITLSEYYDDMMYATIPAFNKDREVEAFVPENPVFTDIDDTNPDYFDVKMLAKTGIIKGDENGAANIYDNVTRAEAVAMIMRFLGLESMPSANAIVNFEDVSKNDWFYSVIMAAYKCGIVTGDSKTVFAPERNVTREEITVMTARALKYAELKCIVPNNDRVIDIDSVSDWAKEAYNSVGYAYISDFADDPGDDLENPNMVFKPQNIAIRKEIAYVLNGVKDICQFYPSQLAVKYGFDKEMPIIDGSTSTHPFTQAVYGKLFYNGLNHEMYPVKHSKSHASYERLINGEVDMLFASVYPASDILKLAEDKGVELELIPIAYDAMIFFTNADNPADNLTQEQIRNIYVNNAYDNWNEIGGSDALLYPYCRNNDSGSHAQMEKHFLLGDQIHPDVQKETSMTMSNVLTDVMGAKTDDPLGYGLGYSIYYYFNNMDLFYNTLTELKLLKIDGIAPSDETIADGTYPLSNNTYIVLRKDTPQNSPARKMAEFMLTEVGQECVEDAGFGRLK